MRQRRLTLVVLMMTILMGSFAPSGLSEPITQRTIGVLAPLTGDLSQLGNTAKVGVEIAERHFEMAYPDVELNLVIEDTQSNPDRALDIVKNFFAQGIQHIIAAVSSQELLAIKPFTDEKGMVVISPTSTSPSLALDDSIIRIMPNDTLQAQALAAYINHLGIHTVVPLYREDVYGTDFFLAFQDAFEEIGGQVSAGVSYDPQTTDFSPIVNEVAAQVQVFSQSDSTSTPAVLAISYGEIYSIFLAASPISALSTVPWLGTADYARNSTLLNDPISRDFALQTQFTTSVFSRQAMVHPYASLHPASENLVTWSREQYPDLMESDVECMFDSLWLMGLLVHKPNLLKELQTPSQSNRVIGYTGNINFDENGDPEGCSYSFYRFLPTETTPTWALVGSYWPTRMFDHPVISYREFIPDGLDKRVQIGLLLSLTGENATLGNSILQMVNQAKADIDAVLQRNYTLNSGVDFILADTQSDPVIALAKIQEMKQQGIQFVIGPLTSEELTQVADFVNQNDMILISPTSTAPSLALDDNIFRTALDDRKQAKALATLMIDEGYTNIVFLYRHDTYGSELKTTFQAIFEELGGRCELAVSYDPQTLQFDEVVTDLLNLLHLTPIANPFGEAAILLISLDEGVEILETLDRTNSLLSVYRWFGADGLAGNQRLLDSPSALAMARQIQLSATRMGMENYIELILTKSFLSQIRERLDFSPTAYEMAAYDSAWLFTLLHDNQDWNTTASSFADLRSDFIHLANNSFGYRSMNAMNEFGDCMYGSIDFHSIDADSAAWNVFASYRSFVFREGLVYFEDDSSSWVDQWSLFK